MRSVKTIFHTLIVLASLSILGPGIRADPAPAQTEAVAAAARAEHEARLAEQDKILVADLKGQLIRRTLPPSAYLDGRAVTAWVYLPPGYGKARTRYPVAYILHGAPGGLRDPFVNANVHRVAEQLIVHKKIWPMILVGWEGNGPQGLDDVTDYLDRTDGTFQMETFVTNQLVPWVDSEFHTQARAQSRALIGFSAGGYGAANIGLKHPELFSVIASHAGFFDPRDDAENMSRILGPIGPRWDEESPLKHVRELPIGTRLHFYMDVGREDESLGEFKKMRAELRARDIDYESHIFAGAHTWEYLNQHYRNSLQFVDARWKEMASEKREFR